MRRLTITAGAALLAAAALAGCGADPDDPHVRHCTVAARTLVAAPSGLEMDEATIYPAAFSADRRKWVVIDYAAGRAGETGRTGTVRCHYDPDARPVQAASIRLDDRPVAALDLARANRAASGAVAGE